MENIQAGLTKEFTENNWKKMQVKLMTIPQFKWYIEKCKVPEIIRPLIWKYRMIFGQNPAEVQIYPDLKFYIELELVKDTLKGQWKEPEPFYTEPYKQNLTSQEAIEQMVKTQLEAKFIQPCKRPGPYQASCTVVYKKANLITGEKEPRVCFDYKGLNANSKNIGYPIPRIHIIKQMMKRHSLFTGIDITSAYNHIEVEEDTRRLLQFAVDKLGKYEPLRMPFGPKGAPGIFATAMQQTFQDLYPTGWFGQYFDDLTVAANSEQELLSRLVMVFDRIKAKKLTVKLTKCDWNKKELHILGGVITQQGEKIQPKNIEAIQKFEVTQENVPSFLGLANYMTQFILKLATIAKVLRETQGRSACRKITDKECQSAIKEIKKLITTESYLKMIDPNLPVIIQTDASETAGGAVLLQKENDKLTPRGYYSYTFTPTERRWQSMVAKEAMVIRKAIEHFKRDIKMVNPNWITIQTDNQTLVNMIRKPAQYEGEVQMAKYRTMNYYVEHIKGENNVLADALSRELKAKNNPVDKLDRILVEIVDNDAITAQLRNS